MPPGFILWVGGGGGRFPKGATRQFTYKVTLTPFKTFFTSSLKKNTFHFYYWYSIYFLLFLNFDFLPEEEKGQIPSLWGPALQFFVFIKYY
jgi:hypothetical protein